MNKVNKSIMLCNTSLRDIVTLYYINKRFMIYILNNFFTKVIICEVIVSELFTFLYNFLLILLFLVPISANRTPELSLPKTPLLLY